MSEIKISPEYRAELEQFNREQGKKDKLDSEIGTALENAQSEGMLQMKSWKESLDQSEKGGEEAEEKPSFLKNFGEKAGKFFRGK